MKILFCDCTAGIAGDMMVAALIDLGVPLTAIEEGLALLDMGKSSYQLSVEQVQRLGMRGLHFQVTVSDDVSHRHYSDIVSMIDASRLAEPVKAKAQSIFRRLAEAEAKVHGVSLERVHFHEVGAVDSIVDIVATAIGLDYLGVEELHAAPLPFGSGFVETAHGLLPVPAPATAELMQGLPVHGKCGPGERVTPTGAAILAALGNGFGAMPDMQMESVGCGAGTKDFADMPNILRLIIGTTVATAARDEVTVLETNIDDMNPEILGFLMERLFAAGALDVAYSPLQMKKNRPGTGITIMCRREDRDQLAHIVLSESTAIGVRVREVQRIVLERRTEERMTSLGRVKVKIVSGPGTGVRVTPEFEDCRRIATDSKLPLLEVYRLVEREACSR